MKNKTELGMMAKVYMDSSQTVPDQYFITVLRAKLAEPDCLTRGWLMDGFPHMKSQVEELFRLGIVPDKVTSQPALSVSPSLRTLCTLWGVRIVFVSGNFELFKLKLRPAGCSKIQGGRNKTQENFGIF